MQKSHDWQGKCARPADRVPIAPSAPVGCLPATDRTRKAKGRKIAHDGHPAFLRHGHVPMDMPGERPPTARGRDRSADHFFSALLRAASKVTTRPGAGWLLMRGPPAARRTAAGGWRAPVASADSENGKTTGAATTAGAGRPGGDSGRWHGPCAWRAADAAQALAGAVRSGPRGRAGPTGSGPGYRCPGRRPAGGQAAAPS